MPVTATKTPRQTITKPTRSLMKSSRSANGMVDVLTLAEAAKYLRVSEADVLTAIAEQNLPARQVGKDWRILQSAIQQWLVTPQTRRTGKGAFQALAGVWKDDPSVESMLAEIYRQRGRPMVEAST